MKQIKIQCPAKVNLTLKVTGKREDGFHNIDSTMQTINLFDFLTISVEKNKIIRSPRKMNQSLKCKHLGLANFYLKM